MPQTPLKELKPELFENEYHTDSDDDSVHSFGISKYASLVAFLVICLFIIPLSGGLRWSLFKIMSQLIGLTSVGVTNDKK